MDKLDTDVVSMSAVWTLGLTLAFNVLNIMTPNLVYCIAMPFFLILMCCTDFKDSAEGKK